MLQKKEAVAVIMGQEAGLNPDQLEFFEENGYLVVPDFWSNEVCEELRKQIALHVAEFVASEEQIRSVFTTDDQSRKSDQYFLESGNKIRYFMEERAFEERDPSKLRQAIELSINKIGHALHVRDPIFRKYSLSSRLVQMLKSLGYQDPLIPQSMYIFKQPSIGGEVRPHQDGTFLYTEPQSVVGFWWPLEDCTTKNGCLWAVPGSHKLPVKQRFKRNADNTGTVLEPPQADPFDLSGGVPLEVKKGSLVIIHGGLVHYSEANQSSQSRHAYSVHIVESKDTKYPSTNWLQYPEGESFPKVYEEAAKRNY